MMNIVRGRNLVKEWQGKVCFEQVDIDIYEGERLALFGNNGVGKTTLLEILAGEEEPTEGTIERGLSLTQWGFMKQTSEVLSGMSTLEAAQYDSTELYQIKENMKRLEQALGRQTIDSNEFLLEEYGNGFADHKPLFDKVDLIISRGDRLAVRGPNGTGKSTLLLLMIVC